MQPAHGPEEADRPEVARALELLRSQGERVTGPRRRVLRAVARLGGHPDIGQIHAAVQQEAPTHLATTYRALEHLSGAGVLTHVHVDHATARYHLAPVTGSTPHVHAACRECGDVLDLPAQLLAPAAEHLRARGYAPDFSHTALSVTCPACLAGQEGDETAAEGDAPAQSAAADPVSGG